MNADLIIHNAGQLVTCASGGKPKRGSNMLDVGIIENGSVAVVDDKIAAVGTSPYILSKYQGDNMIDADGRIRKPLRRCVVRPIDDERLADNVLARHEAPVAAVERGIAIVAHREVAARRYDHFATLHMGVDHLLRALVER